MKTKFINEQMKNNICQNNKCIGHLYIFDTNSDI